ncbi:hypothetical protein TNCV_3336911 [Trichonephila clavipes]|nr:hypothetical protein TNCV_3336911 [Trichonephila clavipes]
MRGDGFHGKRVEMKSWGSLTRCPVRRVSSNGLAPPFSPPEFSINSTLLLLLIPPNRQRPDKGQRNSSWQRTKRRLSLTVALSPKGQNDLARSHPNFEGEHPEGGQGASLDLSSASNQPHKRTCGSTAI